MEIDDISEQYIITNTHLRKECNKTAFRIMQNNFFSIFRFVQSIPSLNVYTFVVIACDWTGLFEVVSSKKAVVVLLIYLQEAMYNKSVDENTTNQ